MLLGIAFFLVHSLGVSADELAKIPAGVSYIQYAGDKDVGQVLWARGPSQQKAYPDAQAVILTGLRGWGYAPEQRHTSYTEDDEIALLGAVLERKDKTITEWQIRHTGLFGLKGKVLTHRGPDAKGEVDSNLYASHPLLDLPLLFLYCARKLEKGHLADQKIQFLSGKSPRVVDLVHSLENRVQFGDKSLPAERFMVWDGPHNLLTMDVVAHDGYYFHARVSLEVPDKGVIRLIANKVFGRQQDMGVLVNTELIN
jgi:hypothetical protein